MDPTEIDPAMYQGADLRKILSARDISALYRALLAAGLTQRQIGQLTGQSQSQVCEIVRGRRVLSYDVLARIADGLSIPRSLMGLSYGDDGAYRGPVTVTASPEGAEDMLRRHLLALGATATFGGPIAGLGEFAELPTPSPVPAPTRVSPVHVTQVQDLTTFLRTTGRAFGADADLNSRAAGWAASLLDLPGHERVRGALLSAVAGLHISAGWGIDDAGLPGRALYAYTRGLELAREAGDRYLTALALVYAGMLTVDRGHPDDGLKMLQMAQVTAWQLPADHPRRTAVHAAALEESAIALIALGQPHAAWRDLGRARELFHPTQPYGDVHNAAARLELGRGRLDAAEPFARASVQRWETTSNRAHSQGLALLATIHVRAGEPDGPQLADRAITAVTRLRSTRARKTLLPLAAALDTRTGNDYPDLARTARKVATTRT